MPEPAVGQKKASPTQNHLQKFAFHVSKFTRDGNRTHFFSLANWRSAGELHEPHDKGHQSDQPPVQPKNKGG